MILGGALLAGLLAAVGAALLVPGPPVRRLRAGSGRGPHGASWEPSWWSRARAGRQMLAGRGRVERRRRVALEVCDAFSAELAAGRPVREAFLASAPPGQQVCPSALAACRLGGDVPVALRHDAQAQRVRLWGSLAACWAVGEGSGAGLAAAVDRLVAGARADEEVRREVVAALAAPRATARVLAVLPVVGLGLGTAVGAHPVSWLTGSAVGASVLAAGVAFAAAGVGWTAALARSVERQL